MNNIITVQDFLQPVLNNKPIICAGPCSVESEIQIQDLVKKLSALSVNIIRGGAWKPRTRPGSFEGHGSEALMWLKKAGSEVNLPVAVEVATPEHVELCLKHNIDILWIGARTTVNPFAVQSIADSLCGVDIPVMVKNPVNPDLTLWIGAFERLNNAGIKKIIAIHRGFSVPIQTNLRNAPIWRIPLELRRLVPELRILCDPSHICGNRNMIQVIAQEAMDLIFDGLMIEVHSNPNTALSDAQKQITPEELDLLIANLILKSENINDPFSFSQLENLRFEIDTIDFSIIESLGKRMNIVKQIAECKKKANLSTYQPKRWQQIVESRTNIGAKHTLNQEFIYRLFELIQEESIQHQFNS